MKTELLAEKTALVMQNKNGGFRDLYGSLSTVQCLTSTASTPGHLWSCDSSCRVVKFYESPHRGCDVTGLGRPSTGHYCTRTCQFILSAPTFIPKSLCWNCFPHTTEFAYSDMWEGRGDLHTLAQRQHWARWGPVFTWDSVPGLDRIQTGFRQDQTCYSYIIHPRFTQRPPPQWKHCTLSRQNVIMKDHCNDFRI